jgi:hypothetical protein
VEDACSVTVGRIGACCEGAVVVLVVGGVTVFLLQAVPTNTIASRTSRVNLPNEFLRILYFLLD